MTRTVLLVDDSMDMLDMTRLLFEQAGVECLTACTLAEVQTYGDRLAHIALAILDVNLGPAQPSGVEVSAWLRARNISCRIVFLTGHAPDHPLVQQAAGIESHVLTKPIKGDELIRIARGRDD
ncbi:MAG TPA: response regulator [Kofleriaceae bacterium]|nr:response regulator [Kofleriaceae bacterium]